MKEVAIFGSTGSIGKSTIDVIKNSKERLKIKILTSNTNFELLAHQANNSDCEIVAIEDEKKYNNLKSLIKNSKCKIIAGKDAASQAAQIKCDIAIMAIVGAAAIKPCITAIKSQTNIALANKEALVCAGEFIIKAAKKNNVKIIPVDSEHNAIFQIFENKNLNLINNIILTASGGPFFNSKKNFEKITINEALKHPNWKMGAKISIDSATMMNKGLEMIEAYHLFPIEKNKIKILVHPQSIIHGIVNYSDGSSLAMMSLPDMKVPISYAISHPNRMNIKNKELELELIKDLSFFAADEKKFPAIKLCKQVLIQDGNSPTILNAANEVAVEKFLKKEIKFSQITDIVEECLSKIDFKKPSSIEDVLETDSLTRKIAKKCLK